MVYERFRLLASAEKYLRNISESERARIDADMYAMSLGDESQVKTKQLRGAIRELIAGSHRLTYFALDGTLYFVRGFRKKSAKTPRQEIEYAEQVHKILKQK